MEYAKGEEVVFCPVDRNESIYRNNCGASGEIIDRETTKKGTRVRVKSFLVKWHQFRRGVASFRLRGKKRGKSDWLTELFATKYRGLPQRDVSRFEETAKGNIHPLSYCHDCPLRLRRLVTPCDMTKAEAIKKYGEAE